MVRPVVIGCASHLDDHLIDTKGSKIWFCGHGDFGIRKQSVHLKGPTFQKLLYCFENLKREGFQSFEDVAAGA